MCQNIGTTFRALFGLDPLESHHKIRNKYIVTRTANFGGKQNEESNMMRTFELIFNIMLYQRYKDMEQSEGNTSVLSAKNQKKYDKEHATNESKEECDDDCLDDLEI
eukprot:440675_1